MSAALFGGDIDVPEGALRLRGEVDMGLDLRVNHVGVNCGHTGEDVHVDLGGAP